MPRKVGHAPDSQHRQIIQTALRHGWELCEVDGRSHGIIRWPATGETVSYGSSPGDVNSVRNLAKDIQRISGVVVWARGNRKPSKRRTIDHDPIDLEDSGRRNTEWRRKRAEQRIVLRNDLAALHDQLAATDPRREPQRARTLAALIVKRQAELDHLE